jgi:hypothetical protein
MKRSARIAPLSGSVLNGVIVGRSFRATVSSTIPCDVPDGQAEESVRFSSHRRCGYSHCVPLNVS